MIERRRDHAGSSEARRLINGEHADVNQLCPIQYEWAWRHYLHGCANHWMPTEVPMQRDIAEWRSGSLSEDERRVILRNLGFFATGESLVANNLVLAVYRHVTSPECRQYLLRQAFEEAVHTHAFEYICDSLELDQREVFDMYREVDSIAGKDEFVASLTEDLLEEGFSTRSPEDARRFLRNLIGFYAIMEGIFFYSGFAMVLAFHRRNRMTGIGEQFQYIVRDESVHMSFGLDLVRGVRAESPGVWTPEFEDEVREMIDTAVEYEVRYAKDCLPNGVLGLNADLFDDYVRYVADRRLERLGMAKSYDARNPFPWMSEAIDLAKEKNFFETRVNEYRSAGSLVW